jgi:lysophospholipase L1-like esterase
VTVAARVAGRESPVPPSVKVTDSLADLLASDYLRNRELVQAIAKARRGATLFVWQPRLSTTRKPLTDDERRIAALTDASVTDYERRAAARVEAAAGAGSDLRFLSAVFDTVSSITFVDQVHLTSEGNARVAEALAPIVARAIEASPRRDRGRR